MTCLLNLIHVSIPLNTYINTIINDCFVRGYEMLYVVLLLKTTTDWNQIGPKHSELIKFFTFVAKAYQLNMINTCILFQLI